MKTPPTVTVHISDETNRWNTLATKLVALALQLHDTIRISSLTNEEIAAHGLSQ